MTTQVRLWEPDDNKEDNKGRRIVRRKVEEDVTSYHEVKTVPDLIGCHAAPDSKHQNRQIPSKEKDHAGMNNEVKDDDGWIRSTCVHNADRIRNDCELGSENKENI